MEENSIETARPMRQVEVDYNIDQDKCKICKDKPCLDSCPINAVFIDSKNGKTKIKNTCFGCVLCRNSCPYDAITMETKLSPPIRDNPPKVNSKLCKACGGCVSACKIGAIHLKSTADGNAYSEIDEDKCVRCGYCYRSCPTDAIKYGHLKPKHSDDGDVIEIDSDKCIGCMTCSRVCPSDGAIDVNKVNKLPFINPNYCVKCEECMHSCPTAAINYNSHDKVYEAYSKNKSANTIAEISKKDTRLLSHEISKLDDIYLNLAKYLSSKFDEDEYYENKEINVTDKIINDLDLLIGKDIAIEKLEDLFNSFLVNSNIKVDNKVCIGCGLCLNECLVNALELELPAHLTIKNNCIYCGKCVNVCPVDAITLYDDFYKNEDDEIYYCRNYISGLRDGKFNISNSKCQKCGICTNFCPTNAITLENNEIKFHKDLCIYCRNCELICPVNAIDIDIK